MTPELKEQTNRRRLLIFRRVVLANHPISVKEMLQLLGVNKYTKQMEVDDVEAFKKIGCNIAVRSSHINPNDSEIYFCEGPHTDDDDVREDQNKKEKQLVARLAASLISAGRSSDGVNQLPLSWLNEVESKSVLTQLDKHSGRLKIRFSSFWSESSRLIAIDSGTTNIELAELLRTSNFPLPGAGVRSLAVCTNSRKIFNMLGQPGVSIKTIIIGGQQKFRSPTIAGMMAETFLRSVSILQFGICIIGSTRVDLDQFAICSDSSEESSIKNLIMDRSSLRIICVDDSKLQKGPGRESYKFASIDPDHVDLIITNSPIKDEKRNSSDAKTAYDLFVAKVKAIEERGVPVLVATSDLTFSYPEELNIAPDA